VLNFINNVEFIKAKIKEKEEDDMDEK